MAAGCEEDLFGVDGCFGAVVEIDFDVILASQMGSSVDVFDFIIVEILLVDSVETPDVGVALVLEGRPVKGGSGFDREAIGFGFMDGFGNGSGVPGDFLWDTARSKNIESIAVSSRSGRLLRAPHIDTSTPQAIALYGYRLCSIYSTSPSS